MSATDDAKKKAAATYNAAADFYDHPTNTFWERYGRRTIERLELKPGARVLDVCCGSGAAEMDLQPIDSPEDWWPMVMGSGYRSTVEQLSTADQERVQTENLDFIRNENIRSVKANVLYAQATA